MISYRRTFAEDRWHQLEQIHRYKMHLEQNNSLVQMQQLKWNSGVLERVKMVWSFTYRVDRRRNDWNIPFQYFLKLVHYNLNQRVLTVSSRLDQSILSPWKSHSWVCRPIFCLNSNSCATYCLYHRWFWMRSIDRICGIVLVRPGRAGGPAATPLVKAAKFARRCRCAVVDVEREGFGGPKTEPMESDVDGMYEGGGCGLCLRCSCSRSGGVWEDEKDEKKVPSLQAIESGTGLDWSAWRQ